jgi:signal peptidase II
LPEAGGYAPLFYGKVVDMLYFPLITNAAGETVFFRPVFNFADASISVGVVLLLLFYRKEISEISFKKKSDAHEA